MWLGGPQNSHSAGSTVARSANRGKTPKLKGRKIKLSENDPFGDILTLMQLIIDYSTQKWWEMTALSISDHSKVHLPFLFHSGHIPETALLDPTDSSKARSLALKVTKYSSPSSENCPFVLWKIGKEFPEDSKAKCV